MKLKRPDWFGSVDLPVPVPDTKHSVNIRLDREALAELLMALNFAAWRLQSVDHRPKAGRDLGVNLTVFPGQAWLNVTAVTVQRTTPAVKRAVLEARWAKRAKSG